MEKLITISELSKLLNLMNKKTKKPNNHILRFWEKEFSQIKPIIIKKRRYYSNKQIEIIKLIKFLLKDQDIRIQGVRKILKSNIKSLDDYQLYSLKMDHHKNQIKQKSKNILSKLEKIKQYGKKNSY